eukprot:364743-Chlamydomonas_euryale.AAC.42
MSSAPGSARRKGIGNCKLIAHLGLVCNAHADRLIETVLAQSAGDVQNDDTAEDHIRDEENLACK